MNYIQFVKKYMTENPSFRNNHRTLRSAMMSEEAKEEYGKSVKHKRKATKGKRMKAPVEAPKVKDDKKCPPPCPPVVVNVTCPGGNVTSSAPVYHRHHPQQGTAEQERNMVDESTIEGSSDDESTDSAEYLNGTPDSNNIAKIYNSNDTPKEMKGNPIRNRMSDMFKLDNKNKSGLFDNPLFLKQQDTHNLREAKLVDEKVSPSAPVDVPLKTPSAPPIKTPSAPVDVPVKTTVETGTSPEPMEETTQDYGVAETKKTDEPESALVLSSAEAARDSANTNKRLAGKLVDQVKEKQMIKQKVKELEDEITKRELYEKDQTNSMVVYNETVKANQAAIDDMSDAIRRLERDEKSQDEMLRAKSTEIQNYKLLIKDNEGKINVVKKLLFQSGITADTYRDLSPDEIRGGIERLLREKRTYAEENKRLSRLLTAAEEQARNLPAIQDDSSKKQILLLENAKRKLEIENNSLANAFNTLDRKNRLEREQHNALVIDTTAEYKERIDALEKALEEAKKSKEIDKGYQGENPAISSYMDKMPLSQLVSNDALKDLTVEQVDSLLDQISSLNEDLGLADRIVSLPRGKQERVNLLKELGNKPELKEILLDVDAGKVDENLQKRKRRRQD
jgi:hypothetical protein